MAMLWILNLSDVTYSVLDIAERARLPFAVIVMTARLLKQNGLLRNAESKVPSQDPSRHN
jgi:aminopeptidase-like protein